MGSKCTKKIQEPFGINEGFFDLKAKNEAYFKHAEKMLEMAVNQGFTPALVLLWCNYIPRRGGEIWYFTTVSKRRH